MASLLCANCGVSGVDLFVCSGCKLICYCSKICQKNDWKKYHKTSCHKFQKVLSDDSSKSPEAANRLENKKEKIKHGEIECANCGCHEACLSKCSRCKLTSYCCQACQRQHWIVKGGHKEFCIPTSDRLLNPVIIPNKEGEMKCAICQESISAGTQYTLCCFHVFHFKCILKLQESQCPQVCPICRSTITEQADVEESYKSAHKIHKKLKYQITRGVTSWNLLTSTQKTEMCKTQRLLLNAAAQEGHLKAQLMLSDIYQHGHGLKQDDSEAFFWIKKAALQGDVFAQFSTGTMYFDGRGVTQSDSDAFSWFKIAAMHGDCPATAQLNVAMMYKIGQGVKQSYNEAFHWYGKAAQQGNCYAQNMLGGMYLNGEGVKQSDTEAFRLFMRSALNGESSAQFNLGVLYSQGRGVKQSHVKSFHWRKKAAQQGNVDAQFILGDMYRDGQGVKQSDTESFRWFEKAGKQGHVKAQFNMGQMFFWGRGVTQSYPKAFQDSQARMRLRSETTWPYVQ